ncbi:class I SAM-dependent methyltransferase [Christiangramia sediminis]|uniref:Class I SAM-dependent methyltransferase n=1 Tax=Christiangramia sediminis TaxID=2881336 RepID=A0A9X1LJ44_9FLAO|nr:class I SAM-dependent methyltransferase [Christiangramia sediminis]MCB7481321.1 class I SAM-dependent methyltransferase [Christiangramia sediminis]
MKNIMMIKFKKHVKKKIKRTTIYKNYMLWKEGKKHSENSCHLPGHFYSPIILKSEIVKYQDKIWNSSVNLNGIDLEEDNQIKLLDKFIEFYEEMPFTTSKLEGLEYYFDNGFYSYTDGIILYSMMRYLKPKSIIEVGSGFSSALMIDVNRIFFDSKIQINFIEPYPERLKSLISDKKRENVHLQEMNVQLIPLDAFKNLEQGDILFIDSSHVVKTGSDVNYIISEILPILKDGVYIHFHDIFYPFEYPREWVLEGRNWNEIYFLKSFLMYNKNFKIRFFSHYLHLHHKDAFLRMPLSYKNFGGNLWLEKV